MPLPSSSSGRVARLVQSTVTLLISSASASSTTPVYPYDVANAIIYGYPLALYVQTYYPVLESKGSNTLRNDNTTSTSSHSSLVRPNANYVYTAMAVDLSSDNVVITIPNITDGRSYVYPFYDLYGDMVAAIGSATNSPPGDYLLRPAENPGKPGLTMYHSNDSLGDSPYQGIIDFPGTYGSMDARLLLRNNGSDLDTIHRYQNETHTRTVPRQDAALAPQLTTSLLSNGSIASVAYSNPGELSYANATAILSLLAKLAPYNPPKNECYVPEVETTLVGAGIVNGSYMGKGFNETVVNTIIKENLIRVFHPGHIYWNDFGKGWWNYKSYFSGDFHQAYGIRAVIAYVGYLEMAYTESLYPEYFDPTVPEKGSSLTLSGNESYIFTFSSRPPAQFWSVTIYGIDNYLVPNMLERYALSCTDETITYANGTKVYPTGQHNDQYYLGGEREDPFQILIQPADKIPPANWTGNWLPAQAGGGQFSVNFRTYGPSPALTNGSYVYPVVTKQNAVV